MIIPEESANIWDKAFNDHSKKGYLIICVYRHRGEGKV